MKIRRILAFFLIFLVTVGAILLATEPVRKWRTKTGGELEAAWDTSADSGGEDIRLVKEGKNYRVKLDKLSEEDVKYVQERRAELASRTAVEPSEFIPEEEETPTPTIVGEATETEVAENTEAPSGMEAEKTPTEKANKKYAVLVGVNEYEKLNSLRFAADDVNLIRDQLLTMGFEPDHIFTLSSGSGVSTAPVKRIIEERLNQVLGVPAHPDPSDATKTIPAVPGLAGKDDMIFLAFAGHGMQIDETIYFCPQDTQEEVVHSAVSISDIMKRLEDSPARFKWMVIDACRDNPFSARSGGNPNARSIQKIDDPPKGLMILQSCANMEQSYEDEEFKHGIFSYNFVEGLKGAADTDKDGKLTLTEVCKYTTEKTVDMSVQRFNKYQRPYMTGTMSDFIIVDDLLIDGITREEWNKAEGLYKEACAYRKDSKFKEAEEKIAAARKINKKRQEYIDEEGTIKWWLNKEAETARKLAEAEAKAKSEAEARKKAEEEARKAREEAQASVSSPSSSSEPSQRVSSIGVGSRAGEKKTLTVNGVDYTFCWCPAGEFMMGSPKSEEGRFDDETQHRVKLTKGFWMLETEVTQKMWKSVMGTTIEEQRDKANKDWNLAGVGPQNPMYYVSWEECVEFCEKLSGLTKSKIKLPTEAEWEYACRAGTTGEYGGTGSLDAMGWYEDNSGERTHEVKTKKANAWGLYDMHGNVWEWCSDWYDKTYYENSPGTDPVGPNSGSNRVGRGGGWGDFARYCRSALRSDSDPTGRRGILGFRLALVPSSSR